MKEWSVVDYAWVGDSILGLYMRMLLLENGLSCGPERGELFKLITSNQFLSSFGKPTEVEAEIGRVYSRQGLGEAYAYIEKRLMPVLSKQLKNKGYLFQTYPRISEN